VVEDSDSDEYVACVDIKEQVCAVENPDHKDRLLVFMLLMLVTECHSGQLDTGDTVNTLHEESFKEICSEDSLPCWAMLKSAFTEENRLARKASLFLVYQPVSLSLVRQTIMAFHSEEPSPEKQSNTT